MTPAPNDLLLTCLDDIRAGRLTLDECASQHPELRQDILALATLVGAGQDYSALEDIDDGTRARVRAGLRAAMGVNGHHPAQSARLGRELGRKPWLGAIFAWPLDRIAAVAGVATAHGGLLPAIGAGIGAALAGGAVVYAAQTAGPESALYPVRQAVHTITETLAPAEPTPPPATPTAVPTATATVVVVPTAARGEDALPRATGGSRAAGEDDSAEKRELDREHERAAGLENPPGSERRPAGIGAERSEGRAAAGEAREGNRQGPSAASSAAGTQRDGGGPFPGPATGGGSDGGRTAAATSSLSGSHDGGGAPGPSPSTSGRDGGSSPSPSASSGSHEGGSPSPIPSTSGRDGGSSPSPSASSGSHDGGSPSPIASSGSRGGSGSTTSSGSGSGSDSGH